MITEPCGLSTTTGYSVFGIAVDRRKTLKWLFPQEKATFHNPEKVYVYSENALIAGSVSL